MGDKQNKEFLDVFNDFSKVKGLKCIYTNADQLRNKMDELRLLMKNHNPHIVCITEVKPKRAGFTLSPAEISVDGYNLYVNDLSAPASTRGCAIYISNKIKATQVTINGQNEDSVWVEINLLNTDKLLVGCIYRSPNADAHENDIVNKLLVETSNMNFSHKLIMGDFNFKNIDWSSCSVTSNDKGAANFLDAVGDGFYYQHVTKATRLRIDNEPSLLDLIFTNEENMVENLEHTSPLGKSDHVVISFGYNCYSPPSDSSQEKFQYNRGNYDKIRNRLQAIDWNEFFTCCKDVDAMWNRFCELVQNLMDKHIPKKKPCTKRNKYLTPLDANAIRKIKKKHRAWNRYMESKESQHYRTYCRLRSQVKQISKQARMSQEKEIANDSKTNPKKFWQFVNKQTKTRDGVGKLKSGNIYAESDKDKAEVLLDQFSSVFTRETTNPPYFPERDITEEDEPPEITEEMIAKKLNKLNVCKSAGPDGIHPRILKELSGVITTPLTLIFRKSVESAKIPKSWKTAIITPLFKKGKKEEPSNYRPVSLTAIASKILESFFRETILDHMRRNNLLSNKQFGFLNGRSTVLQLLTVMDQWMKLTDDNANKVDAVYLDFQKAFDTVPHQRLITKMRGYGIHQKTISWIEDFLSDREQKVRVNGSISSSAPVTSGIPQGSVLGPVLFVLYINDLPDVVTNEVYMFADDTKIFSLVNNDADAESLQDDIRELERWSNDWLLKFNASKCKVLHLGKTKSTYQYQMDSTILEESGCEKDLGVHVDNELSFSQHIDIVVKKANRVMGLIRRSFRHLDRNIFLKLYKSLVRPHLEYGVQVWHPYLKSDIRKIESVQRRATKQLNDLREDDYATRLKLLKLPTLLYRRLRGDAIETYKLLTDKYDPEVADLLTLHDEVRPESRTRGNYLKLFKKNAKHKKCMNSFSFRVTDMWNRLPNEVISAPTIKAFEGRLDRHWENLTVKFDFDTAMASTAPWTARPNIK